MDDIRALLESQVKVGEWEWIKPHLERDAVIIVDATLEIVEVGIKLAQNDAPQVQSWINGSTLTKPNPQQLLEWTDADKKFRYLIVQPFVLIQEISALQ